MANQNAKTSHDLAGIRERARRNILDHGRQARGEWTPEARAEFAATVDGARKGVRPSQNRLATQILPLLRAASLAKLRACGMPLERARQLAHDVANDVFVELLKDDARVLGRWNNASARHDPCAFFRTMARRRAIDAYHRDQRTIHRDADDLTSEPSAPPAASPSVETALMVRECLHRTIGHRRDAEVVQSMVYDTLVANARQAEIACDLGISADAIYQRTSRFRRDFAATWNQE